MKVNCKAFLVMPSMRPMVLFRPDGNHPVLRPSVHLSRKKEITAALSKQRVVQGSQNQRLALCHSFYGACSLTSNHFKDNFTNDHFLNVTTVYCQQLAQHCLWSCVVPQNQGVVLGSCVAEKPDGVTKSEIQSKKNSN